MNKNMEKIYELLGAVVAITVMLVLGWLFASNFASATIIYVGISAWLAWGTFAFFRILEMVKNKEESHLSRAFGCLYLIVGAIGVIASIALSFESWLVALFTFVTVCLAIRENSKQKRLYQDLDKERILATATNKDIFVSVMALIINVMIRLLPIVVYLLVI